MKVSNGVLLGTLISTPPSNELHVPGAELRVATAVITVYFMSAPALLKCGDFPESVTISHCHFV